MPKTNTPSDAAMIEVLARKMGYHYHGGFWRDADSYPVTFFPLQSLDAVREVEKRLTDAEWDDYGYALQERHGSREMRFKAIRHAGARTCATALARVIAPELFEGGGE